MSQSLKYRKITRLNNKAASWFCFIRRMYPLEYKHSFLYYSHHTDESWSAFIFRLLQDKVKIKPVKSCERCGDFLLVNKKQKYCYNCKSERMTENYWQSRKNNEMRKDRGRLVSLFSKVEELKKNIDEEAA